MKKDLSEFVSLLPKQESSQNSWTINIDDLNKETWDLSINNPNCLDKKENRTSKKIISEIEKMDAQATKALQVIKELL